MSNQMYNQENESLHKWQLDLSEELEIFKQSLMGYEINPAYKQAGDPIYIKTSNSPFTNEMGATQIKNRLMGIVNKAASDTNLSEKKIGNELKEFDIDTSLWLSLRFQDFGIRVKDYNAVCEMMVEWAILIFHRSVLGWKGGLINAPGNVKEVYYPSMPQENVSSRKGFSLGGFGG